MEEIGDWLGALTVWQVVLLLVAVLVVLPLVSALVTGLLVRRGLRTPWAIRKVNVLRDKAVRLVKRPITIMVLDEVADVIQTGHYTQNIAAALTENREELAELVAEKVRRDPNLRVAGYLPGYHAIVTEVAETTLRVIVEMLGDPRMDELVADLLRNNLDQIRSAVREREHEQVPPRVPPELPTYRS
ncbi:MAG TPA: hypothetical protein VFO98_16625 [Marmoricola sp.]|jgi:hypothetical protein|nr:hypothetical protein [Marmoricola sp.]